MIFRPEGMFGRKEVTYRVFRRFLKRNKQNKPVS